MIIPRRIYDMDLSHRELCVYKYLCERANKKGVCYPSFKTIAKESSLSESTVIRAINDLETRKLITRISRKRSNGGTSSNLYKLEVI